MRPGARAVLLERDDELEVVGQALRRAAGGEGSVIAVAGPLGMGKTALLRSVPRHLDAADCVLLQASAARSELDLAGGVVRQLLDHLACAAADDATVAERLGVLLDLAADSTVLLLVDDLQWADDESLVVIEAFARWVRRLPAVVVVSVREGDRFADRPAVASIVAGATHRLRPKPFTRAGSAALVRERLGRDCDDEFALACHKATDGNPMLLTALVLSWSVEGLPPVAAHAETARRMRPTYARDRLVACLGGLPEPATALMKSLAALGGGLPDAAELAGLDRVALLGVTRSLRRLGLLTATGFAHRAVCDAVEETMTSAEREDLHVRAARLLYDNGRPEEEVARQLLEITRPQGAWAVEVLRVAAETSLRSGSPETAERYLRRALLETSVDGEDRAKVLVDLASAVRGLDVQAAVRCISYAVALLKEPRNRAAALIRLTPMVMTDAPESVVAMLRQVLSELGASPEPVDRELALRIEARLRYAEATIRGDLGNAAARLAQLGPDAGVTTAAERELRAVLLDAATVGVGLPASEVRAQAERLLEQEPASSPRRGSAAPLLVTCLAAAGAPGAVVDWLDQAMDVARSRGDAVEQVVIRSGQALVHLMTGRVAEAGRAATEACELAAGDWSAMGTSTAVVLAGVALQVRDPVLTGQVLAFAGHEPANDCLAAVVGLLRASEAVLHGDPHGAVAVLVECGVRLDRSGWRNPVLFPWRTSLALLKKRLGDTEDAMALAEEERLIAQDWGAASAQGRALRVLGAVVGDERGEMLTRRAVEVLESSAHALELALALRQLAEMSGSVDVWRRCLEVAEDIGVRNIADQARAVLTGTQSAPVRLTPSERRVAMLAVAGQSNQEIAEALEVTPRAVEKHLTNTYRKLGVRRRAELAEALHHVGAGHS